MISIIGAGPAGNYLAYLLASKGVKVNVYEEHDTIGLPVQCTGIVTSELAGIINIRKAFLVNKLDFVRVFGPKEKLELELKKPNLVIDRTKFDRHIAEMAMNAGAKYFLGWKFLGFDGKNARFNRGEHRTDVLVGADGVHSRVTKLIGNKLKLVAGVQARVSGNFDSSAFNVYLNKDFFGWIVPESDSVARAGVISKYDVNRNFRKFLNEKVGKCKIREYQSGMIPVYDKKIRVRRGNMHVLGDAAGQVKATTFGGICQGLQAARVLFRTLYYGKSYKWGLRKLNKELKYSLLLRRKLSKMNSRDFDELIRMTNQKKIKEVLGAIDRDKPSKLLFKMILREPRYLKFLF